MLPFFYFADTMRLRMGWIFILAASVTLAAADSSNWGNEWAPMESDSMLSRRSTDPNPPAENVQGRNYAVHESTQSNATEIDTVIDQLINSRREGRNLGEYDAVYADGNIDQALQQGNDLQARNLIRDKLCGLGLMSCDVEEKRPFYSTIYAQGPPPPSAFGGGPYGPAKPMPPPSYFNGGGRPPMGPPPSSSLNSFGPPRKVGYESNYKPMNSLYRPGGGQFGGAYLEHPHHRQLMALTVLPTPSRHLVPSSMTASHRAQFTLAVPMAQSTMVLPMVFPLQL